MRFLTLGEVFALHRRILAESGGTSGVRDLGAIAPALSQPKVSVGGQDAYPTLIEKAAALRSLSPAADAHRCARTGGGKNVRGCAAILYSLLTVLIGHITPAAGDDLGVVLLHGKGGSPSGYVRELASALQSKGHLVSTPTMPWAQNRIYDASFDEAMQEIDREIDSLRQKGAKFVVVAGHSLGANAALGYASSRDSAIGIIALAPAHTPELQGFIKRVGYDVGRARALVAAGKGKEKHRFSDVNQGRPLEVAATAEVYLSWFEPAGSAVMPKSAASFKVPTPLLLVVGSGDHGKDYIFDKAPPHPKSKFVTVPADHFTVPSAAIEEVVSWLASLRR